MEKKLYTLIGVLLVVVAVLSGLFVGVMKESDKPAFGSVIQASEYQSTTTYNGIGQILKLKTATDAQSGALGSIVITSPGASIDVYDTTTTILSQRASNLTTNTIRLATIPAEAAVGTYVFDTIFKNGLIVVFGSSDIPTSTVTFR